MKIRNAYFCGRVDEDGAHMFLRCKEDVKFQLKMWFSQHKISACRRSANAVAHELANIGRLYPVDHVMNWGSDVPAQVAACASSDLPEHR